MRNYITFTTLIYKVGALPYNITSTLQVLKLVFFEPNSEAKLKTFLGTLPLHFAGTIKVT